MDPQSRSKAPKVDSSTTSEQSKGQLCLREKVISKEESISPYTTFDQFQTQ